MKVLVVGAGGKTGRAVVEQARQAGHEVTASVYSDHADHIPDVVVRIGDAGDLETMTAPLPGRTPSSTPSAARPLTNARRSKPAQLTSDDHLHTAVTVANR